MQFLCWSYTIVGLSACKTRGHIRTFQRYFDSLTQKASRLLLITTITVDHWIFDAAWRASIQGWENIGSQAIMRKKMILCINKMEVEKLFRALVSPPVMKNEIKSMIGITKLICCFLKWADTMQAPDIFPTNKQQNFCWQPKKLRCMILHYSKIIKGD